MATGRREPEQGRASQRPQPQSRQQPQQQPQSQQQPQFISHGDAYLMERIPGYVPQTEEQFMFDLAVTFGCPITDANREECLKVYKDMVDRFMQGRGANINVIGVKPRPGESVCTVPIPNSDFTIRMWDGGMAMHKQFCLDFYDTRRRTPVNLPPGFSLWSGVGAGPGGFAMGGQLHSWETAFGVRGEKIPPGEEKWSVAEGSYITIKGPNRPDFTFAVPVRQVQQLPVVQAVFGAAY